MAHMRYEGFDDVKIKDFFINLGSDEVHPVGWCAKNGKQLIPPKTIQTKHSNWREFVLKRLTGVRTLPANYHKKVSESVNTKFRVGMSLELIDKTRISQIRVAQIVNITGKRLRLAYNENSDEEFWCHEQSPL